MCYSFSKSKERDPSDIAGQSSLLRMHDWNISVQDFLLPINILQNVFSHITCIVHKNQIRLKSLMSILQDFHGDVNS